MKLAVNGRFLGARTTGVQRFAREVTRRLASLADLSILVPSDARFEPELTGGAKLVRGRLPARLWEQLELPRAARRAGADVTLHPANAAPLLGGPHVVVLHDVTPFTHPDAFSWAYRWWARATHALPARRAAAVVTVSEWAAGEIARALGIAPGRIHVVTQGAAPLDAPASEADVCALRRRLGVDGPWFLAVGTDPRKGTGLLLDAWRGGQGGPDPPPATLLVVGETDRRVHGSRRGGAGCRWPAGTGPESAAVGPVPVAAGSPPAEGGRQVGGGPAVPTATGPGRLPPARVLHLGAVSDDDLRALYTGAVALLFPSRAEGFGRPPLEALACGTRAVVAPYGVASLLGGAVDVVSREPGAWRDAACRLLAEPAAERACRVEAGRRRAAAFSWEECARQVLEVCRRVARRGA